MLVALFEAVTYVLLSDKMLRHVTQSDKISEKRRAACVTKCISVEGRDVQTTEN